MRNLIQESKQKSTNFFTIIDGVPMANHESVRAIKRIGEKSYYWHIERASEHNKGFRKHYICCEVVNGHLVTRRVRLYDNDKEFESAIKRIEKQVN